MDTYHFEKMFNKAMYWKRLALRPGESETMVYFYRKWAVQYLRSAWNA